MPTKKPNSGAAILAQRRAPPPAQARPAVPRPASGLLAESLPESVAGPALAAQALTGLLGRHLPREVAAKVRPARLHQGELLLSCASGALAAKLRMLGPRLLRALQDEGIEVSMIAVHVDAGAARPPAPPPRHGEIPEPALHGLRDLAARLEAGPLRDAVDRLLARRPLR
jgi:hypothetical protein